MKLSLCLLVLLPWLGSVVEGGLLFPHLPGNGDAAFAYNCDDCSEKIAINGLYKFFGSAYSNFLWLGSNGYVTLDAGQWRFTPPTSAFNYGSGSAMIGTYFCDTYLPANIHASGLWFRETTDQSILNRANKIINSHFPICNCGGDFKASHVFIATWQRLASYCEDRSYYSGCPNFPLATGVGSGRRHVQQSPVKREGHENKPGSDNPSQRAHSSDKQNSFQVVIATNGCDTFVFNHIHTIQWECCFADNQMLFNAGNAVGFWKHPNPTSAGLDKASGNSNVGEPGRWAYKVSEKQILDEKCNPIGTAA